MRIFNINKINLERILMKEEIKKFLDENNLVYPTYNRYISEDKFWKKINNNWHDYLFSNFKKFYKISFSSFLKHVIYDEELNGYFHSVEDFLTNTQSTQINKTHTLHKRFFEESHKFINFRTTNMTEIIYCFRNDLKNRKKCDECNNDVKFLSFKNGYAKFCSVSCQLKHNNKLKEVQKSEKSEDEIIEAINKIPFDNRNLSNKIIASNYINILERTKEIKNINTSERLFIFMNKLSYNDILCSCGDKLKFETQSKGYKKTCGKIVCINTRKHKNYYNDNALNLNVSKGGKSYESGFLYILYSKNKDVFKIGVTQDVIKRLTSLKKFVYDFEIEDCFYLKDNLTKIEKQIHKTFSDKNFNLGIDFGGYSEIFKLNIDDLKKIREIINESK